MFSLVGCSWTRTRPGRALPERDRQWHLPHELQAKLHPVREIIPRALEGRKPMAEYGKVPASQLHRLVEDARERTLELVADLTDEQLTVPKMEIVNPFLWELGHVAFFYDVFLLRVLGSEKFLLEGAENLYDSFKVDHDDRWSLRLPSREETLAYMGRVLDRVLDRLALSEPDVNESYLYVLSVLHEDMHGEAFTYMRQTLEYPEPQLGICVDKSLPVEIGGGALPGDVEIPGGTFQLGATRDAPFAFDNEKWAHPVEVSSFRIARAPVTNAEFADFVEDGGYLRRQLWSHQGWTWRMKTGTEHPIYWSRGASGFGCAGTLTSSFHLKNTPRSCM